MEDSRELLSDEHEARGSTIRFGRFKLHILKADGFAMRKIFKLLVASGLLCVSSLCGDAPAAERPTFQVTRDPRPDILPYHLYYATSEYRRDYNRPRYYSGWLASKISRTSQEAMVWQENVQAGNYDEKHMPPMYKRYFAPKPWEVLQTGARPDFPKPQPASTASNRTSGAAKVEPSPVSESAPIELDQ